MTAASSRMSLLEGVAEAVSLLGGYEAIQDPFFYLCGHFLSPKKPIVISSLAAEVSGIWGLKERILIREEGDRVFVFQFKDEEVKNHVLNGGPCLYNSSMLVLADYDDISTLKAVSLQHLEVWVAVKGLRMAMRNERALNLLENDLEVFVRVDMMAVQRKDPVQRVRVIHDVRRRIWA